MLAYPATYHALMSRALTDNWTLLARYLRLAYVDDLRNVMSSRALRRLQRNREVEDADDDDVGIVSTKSKIGAFALVQATSQQFPDVFCKVYVVAR